MKKKSLQEHFVITQNLMFAGFLFILAAILFQHTKWVMILWEIGFPVMIASVFYSNKYFKCPHCETKLDPRRKVPHFCPNCGKKL